MKENKNIHTSEHSERVRRLIEQQPPRIIRLATGLVILFFVILAAVIYFTGMID